MVNNKILWCSLPTFSLTTKYMIVLRRVFLSSLFSILALTFWLHSPAWAISDGNGRDIFNSALENIRQQNYQEALVGFTQVINLNDDLVGAAYSDRCLVNLQLQQYLDGESDCTIALQYNSDNLEARLNLGLTYYRLGESEKAIAEYNEVIKRDRHDYRAYYNRGLAHFALKDYPAAIADYNLALMSNQEITEQQRTLIYSDRGVTYLILEDYQNGIINFNQAINSEPNNYSAYFNRGCAHHRLKNYLAAIEDYTQVIQINPDLTQAYVNRAMLHHKLGRNNNAFEDLDIALEQYKQQGDDFAYQQVLAFKQAMIQSQPSQFA